MIESLKSRARVERVLVYVTKDTIGGRWHSTGGERCDRFASYRGFLSGVLFMTGSAFVIRDGCFRSLSTEVHELKELLVVGYVGRILAVFLLFEHGVRVEL